MAKKWVYFNALGIWVPLKKNQFFFDDGVVDDIRNYVKRLEEMYSFNFSSNKKVSPYWDGITLHLYELEKGIEKEIIRIAYKKDEAGIRGHEEGHAIDWLGKRKFLYSEIIRKYGILQFLRLLLDIFIEEKVKKNKHYLAYVGEALAIKKSAKDGISSVPFAVFVKLLSLLKKGDVA